MNAHQLAAFGEADATAEDLRLWLTTPYVVVENDIRVLERDDRLIGYADVDATRDEPPLWWCDVKVDPDADANEVVPTLVSWLEERAERGRLRVWTSESDRRITDAYAALGFEPARHSYRMEIDLTGRGAGAELARGNRRPSRFAMTSTSSSTTPRSRSGATPPIRSTRRSTSGRTGRSGASRSIPSSGSWRSRATSSPASRSASRARSTRTRATSRRSASAVPGAGEASVKRCSCTRSTRSASAAGAAGRSASTPRAPPAPLASTSARACASTATRSFSSGPCGSRLSA